MDNPQKQSWLEADIENRLEAFLDQACEICSVPESARQVMELTQQEDANFALVVNALMKDTVLAAETLKLANSPFFGQTRQVKSLERAVVVLGMQELHTSASAMAMLAAFASTEELASRLHESAVLSASLARSLAKETSGCDESEAFLAGLLCELGALACISMDKEAYIEIWTQTENDHRKRAELEIERYTARSEEIGARILNHNHIPSSIVAALRATKKNSESLLEKITLFSRRATNTIITAISDETTEHLGETIHLLASEIGITQIKPERLNAICRESARSASLGMQDEQMLYENEDISEMNEQIATGNLSEEFATSDSRYTKPIPVHKDNAGTRVHATKDRNQLPLILVGTGLLLAGIAAAVVLTIL